MVTAEVIADAVEPEHCRKLFVGGLTPNTTEEMMRDFYGKYGELVDVVVVRDPVTKRMRGFGFVTYAAKTMVDECQKARPHVIDGKTVDPKRSDRGAMNISSKKLYVSGIREEHTEEMLQGHFAKFGTIEKVDLIKDKLTKKNRGFAFVTFDDYDCVDQCIIMKSHQINGCRCDVKKSLSKEEQVKVQQAERDRAERNNRSRGDGLLGGGRRYDQGGRGVSWGGGYGGGHQQAGGGGNRTQQAGYGGGQQQHGGCGGVHTQQGGGWSAQQGGGGYSTQQAGYGGAQHQHGSCGGAPVQQQPGGWGVQQAGGGHGSQQASYGGGQHQHGACGGAPVQQTGECGVQQGGVVGYNTQQGGGGGYGAQPGGYVGGPQHGGCGGAPAQQVGGCGSQQGGGAGYGNQQAGYGGQQGGGYGGSQPAAGGGGATAWVGAQPAAGGYQGVYGSGQGGQQQGGRNY